MNVYPSLYETLETERIKFFKEWINDNPRDSNLYASCNHEWKERYMFKCVDLRSALVVVIEK